MPLRYIIKIEKVKMIWYFGRCSNLFCPLKTRNAFGSFLFEREYLGERAAVKHCVTGSLLPCWVSVVCQPLTLVLEMQHRRMK